MSKNRLLQIVNRLGLTNKDKSDLVDIIGAGGNGGQTNNQNIDYWNLENQPISVKTEYKPFSYTIDQLNDTYINDYEITGDLGIKKFDEILFYYTCGTGSANIKFDTLTIDEIKEYTNYCNGVKFNLNVSIIDHNPHATFKIKALEKIKGTSFNFIPISYINKLPKIFYDDAGDVINIQSFDDLRKVTVGQLVKIYGSVTCIALYCYYSLNSGYIIVSDGTQLTKVIATNMGVRMEELGCYVEFKNIITLFTDNNEYNMNIIHNLNNEPYKCNLIKYNSDVADKSIVLYGGEYYNGTITGIKEGNLVKYNVNFETGEITLKQTINFGELEGYEYYETIINLPSGVSYDTYTTYESLGEEGQILKESFKKANKSLHVTVVDKVNGMIYRANDIYYNTYSTYPSKISWVEADLRTTSVIAINDILDDKFSINKRSLMFQE